MSDISARETEPKHRIIALALDHADLSPRDPAVKFTDKDSYVVSEASLSRRLKAHNLIASPAYIVVKTNASAMTRRTIWCHV